MLKQKTRAYLTRLESALCIGLAAAILFAAAGIQMQTALADKMLRLHVIANSDSAEDQALKLKVRDSVLAEVERLTADAGDVGTARQAVESELDVIRQAAEETVLAEGYAYDVRLSLGETDFPTKEYEGFALPAGRYDALRVIIGEGEGQNWWCVLFPPFCTTAAFEEEAIAAGLDEEEIRLMSSDGEYELRFRLIEWIAHLREILGV